MKTIRFLGNSLQQLRDFPENARHDAGYQLEMVQRGEQPDDFKPMPAIGRGVEELRIPDEARFEWYIPHASLTWSMCCMLSNRKRKLRRGGIWR